MSTRRGGAFTNPARDRWIVAAWNSGRPLADLARELDVSPQSVRVTVQRAAKRSGLELARPRTSGAPSADPEPRWFEREQPGRARSAVEVALRGKNLAGPYAITAELLRDVADLVDSARERQDPKLWLAASARLGSLMGQLGIDPAAVPAAPAAPDPIGDALGSDPE